MPVPSVSRSFIATAALAALALTGVNAQSPVTTDRIEMTVDASKAGAKIDRNIFGQFAEHLGRGIYEGVWVGPDSQHSQHPRHPQRRRRRAQGAQGAERAMAGRLLRGRVPLAQGHRAGRPPCGDAQPELGRRHRAEHVRHARVHGLPRPDRRRGVHLGQRRVGHAAGGGRVAGVPDHRAADGAARRSGPPTATPRPTRSPTWASATRAGTAAAT